MSDVPTATTPRQYRTTWHPFQRTEYPDVLMAWVVAIWKDDPHGKAFIGMPLYVDYTELGPGNFKSAVEPQMNAVEDQLNDVVAHLHPQGFNDRGAYLHEIVQRQCGAIEEGS